jgi:hypothetical protein
MISWFFSHIMWLIGNQIAVLTHRCSNVMLSSPIGTHVTTTSIKTATEEKHHCTNYKLSAYLHIDCAYVCAWYLFGWACFVRGHLHLDMNVFSADTSNTSSMVDPIRPNPNGRLHQDWTAADAQQENTSLMCATTIESRAALSATGWAPPLPHVQLGWATDEKINRDEGAQRTKRTPSTSQ